MFEANSLNGVGEFDIDAEVVRIQFQLIAWREAAVLIDVHGQRGNWTVDVERPMPIFRRIRLEGDRRAPHNRAPNPIPTTIIRPDAFFLRERAV